MSGIYSKIACMNVQVGFPSEAPKCYSLGIG